MAKTDDKPGSTLASNPLLPAIAIVICCFVSYCNALGNGFVYDDVPQVLQNAWIKEPGHLGEIFTTNVWAFAGMQTNYYRPLMHVGYLLSHALFGLNAWGFHLCNVLLHAANSLLLYAVVRRLAPVGDESSASPVAALAASLLFACHPIHTEVVTWIGGFTDLSCTFFSLATLLLLMRSDREAGIPPAWRLLAAFSFFLATLCKEPAVVFLAVIAAYDFACNGRRYSAGAYLRRYLPFAVAAAAYFALRFNALGSFSPVSRHQELTPFGALLNVFPLFASYLEKLLFPVHLNAWYVFHAVSSPAEPRLLVSLLVTIVFVAAVCFSAIRHRFTFLCLAIISLPLLPTLYVPVMGENPFAERYLYLPSAGFLMLAGYLIARLARRPAGGAAVAWSVCALIALLYTGATLLRNPVWKDDLAFWRDNVKHSPDGPVPHYNLGAALAASGATNEAIAEYRRAIAIQPAPVAYKSLGAAYLAQGARGEAIGAYRAALELDANDAEGHNELGSIYAEAGQLDGAIEQFEEAVRLQPTAANLRYNLGTAYRQKGALDSAIEQFQALVRLHPDAAATAALDEATNQKRGGGRLAPQ
jgi:protein O-mannosyl-transferase